MSKGKLSICTNTAITRANTGILVDSKPRRKVGTEQNSYENSRFGRNILDGVKAKVLGLQPEYKKLSVKGLSVA